jgi:hypothetical protein
MKICFVQPPLPTMPFIPLPSISLHKPAVGMFLQEDGTVVQVYEYKDNQVILTSPLHGCTLQVGGTIYDTLRYVSNNQTVTLENPFCFHVNSGIAFERPNLLDRSWNDFVESEIRLEGKITTGSESPFYSYSIPKPDVYVRHIGTPLADLTVGADCFHAYWIKNTKQVLLCGNGHWIIQPNGSIRRSLSAFFGLTPEVQTLNIYEAKTTEPCTTDQTDQLYECEWSDYACDNYFIRAGLVI